MTAASDLAGVRAKLRRADEHAHKLDSAVAKWRTGPGYEYVLEPDPDFAPGTVFQERVGAIHEPPDVLRWAVLFGDAMHAYRSALDHLAYELAVRFSGERPPPDHRRIQFPICDSHTSWENAVRRIGSLPPRVLAEIKGLQPYLGGHSANVARLSALREIDDADKHRLLHIAAQVPTDAGFRFLRPPKGDPPRAEIYNSPIELNAVVARLFFTEPQGSVHVTVFVA